MPSCKVCKYFISGRDNEIHELTDGHNNEMPYHIIMRASQSFISKGRFIYVPLSDNFVVCSLDMFKFYIMDKVTLKPAERLIPIPLFNEVEFTTEIDSTFILPYYVKNFGSILTLFEPAVFYHHPVYIYQCGTKSIYLKNILTGVTDKFAMFMMNDHLLFVSKSGVIAEFHKYIAQEKIDSGHYIYPVYGGSIVWVKDRFDYYPTH